MSRISRKASEGNRSELRKVEKREWWLWATAVTVTLLLTVGIASFLPSLLQAQESWEILFGIRQAVWGLLGAVLLFDLYGIHQQLQIQRIRPQLAEREELFRLISESAADMIAVVDLQGRRIYNSISYERVLGYNRADAQRDTARTKEAAQACTPACQSMDVILFERWALGYYTRGSPHQEQYKLTAIESTTGAFATPANNVPAGNPHTILVADDSRVFRKLIENTLSPRYELIFAKTGQEAVDRFSQHAPSLVIVDWMMPDRTGIEICQYIRSHCQRSFTHIIILTAKVEKDSVVAGLEAGADDYLTKPFHNEELVARVGVGIRNIGLHREIEAKNVLLKELALTDALTGLPNRRAIEDWAHRQLSAAARYRFSFWVVATDLDKFKSVNDTYGHEAGDTVLKTFAEILKAHSRSSDICGRIGGEEFLSVITHASRGNARLVVERIRTALEGTRFLFDGRNLIVTASFGLAGVEGSNVPPFGELVAWADSALYTAKRQGRNRVVIADSGVV